MHDITGSFNVTALSAALGVSRAGYYKWRHRRTHPSQCQMDREQLDRLVATAFAARKERSGAPGLTHDLADMGHRHNRKTVAAGMRRQGLVAKAAKKFKSTTGSEHDLPVAPNQKWVCDITYPRTSEGWLYLAVAIDLFSRMVVGWSMDKRMKAKLVCHAPRMALWRRRMPKGVVVHSDRGSQYCSGLYQALFVKFGLVCSMSGKGNCHDNACAQSFFHTLKVEMVRGEALPTREAMRRAVFEYIEIDYNRTRRHSTNGYRSPLDFESQQVA